MNEPTDTSPSVELDDDPSNGVTTLTIREERIESPPGTRLFRILQIIVAMAALFGIIGMIIALVSVTQDRNDLQDELTCRSVSAIGVDQAQANELANIGRGISIITEGLIPIYDRSVPPPENFVETALNNSAALHASAEALDTAVKDRQASIEGCSR